jgi:acyl carrier protein
LPNVEEAIVRAEAEGNSPKRLVAYVRASDPAPDFADQIREGLSRVLPDYMIPEHCVIVPDFPRLPNGKIDRTSLSTAEVKAPSVDGSAGAQLELTEAESLLAELWQEVLGVKTVHKDDNFFFRGGNSLAAMQVIARVQELFGEEIPVTAIFDSPTLSEFAKEIERMAASAAAFGKMDLRLREIENQHQEKPQ